VANMAKIFSGGGFVALLLSISAMCGQSMAARVARVDPVKVLRSFDIEAVRLAVTDMTAPFGVKYPNGRQYLAGLDELAAARTAMLKGKKPPAKAVADMLASLRRTRREALLANPLLDFDKLILLKRRRGQLGLPVNHMCNSGLKPGGYDNEIAVLSPVGPAGKLKTLYRPKGSEFVGEIDLHFNADRLLFTKPVGGAWQVFEIKVAPATGLRAGGSGLRQVSRGTDKGVDSFDACYLPDGRIVFASTASWHAVPCWHGQQRACALYQMKADGSAVRQLCFDQDLDLHPAVLPSGQVMFSRWDYTGTMHMYLRPLMVMNPDGTGQRALYGSNSYWPNSLYFPRGIPGAPNKIIAIVSGYHGVPRMGELVLLDLTKGTRRADGVVQRISGRGKAIKPIIRDKLVEKSWPKFLHPYPLSGKYFLAAAQTHSKGPWSIYLVDVFDNIMPLFAPRGFDVFEPIPLRKTAIPPAIPDKVDLARNDAVCYVQNIYAGQDQAVVRSASRIGLREGRSAGNRQVLCGVPRWRGARGRSQDSRSSVRAPREGLSRTPADRAFGKAAI